MFVTNVINWYIRYNKRLNDESIYFRSKLTSNDITNMKIAKTLFHTSSIAAIIVYYWLSNVDVDVNNNNNKTRRISYNKKFPASISFTIRKGLPQKIHFLVSFFLY